MLQQKARGQQVEAKSTDDTQCSCEAEVGRRDLLLDKQIAQSELGDVAEYDEDDRHRPTYPDVPERRGKQMFIPTTQEASTKSLRNWRKEATPHWSPIRVFWTSGRPGCQKHCVRLEKPTAPRGPCRVCLHMLIRQAGLQEFVEDVQGRAPQVETWKSSMWKQGTLRG